MTGDLKVPRDTEQEDVEQEDAKREEEEEVLIVPEAPASDRTSGGETKEEEKEEIQELTPERRQNQNNAESKVPPEPETTTAPAAKEPPHVAAPNDGRRSKIIAMFVCLICIVLLLQVVIIGLIVDRNQDQEDSTRAADNGEDANNHNDGSSCNDKNVLTMAPIPEPTFVPTSSWTTPPPVPVLADGFVSIANIPGARFLKTVSNCDDCTQIVNLPNRFLFADSYYFYDALEVSSNGRIYIQNCYDGGEAGMENNCGIANVISTDLDPSLTDTAGIWTYDATMRVQEDFSKQPLNGVLPWGAFVISWENVPLCCQDDESSNKLKVGNAQVHLYPNGRIDMCWGFGNDGILFTASIQDLISSRFYPATGQYFDSLGQTMTGLYPSYTCQTIFGEAPSTPPTYSPPPPLHVPAPVSELYPKPFVSLNGVQGARKIIQITDCDDCSTSIRLERIPIRWFEDTYTYEMTVSSNGQMRPDGCDMWDFECAIIDVAFADLDPSQRGDVWFYDATTEAVDYQKQELGSPAVYIFSWEDVAFFPDPYSYLNAQARFYINGTIEFCWGSANTNGFNVAAGLADARYSVSLPAMGGPFGQTGVTTNGEWPTNLCQSFDVTKTVPSIPEQPSLYPTYEPWWGTTSPSLPPPSSCVSTMGQCADHFEALLRYVSGARKGETIAVCGEINVTSSLQLSMPDVTICCVDGYRCGLNSDGTSRILVVTGSYVRLEGLAFHGGNVTGDDGGNLKIDGPGHHKISQCLFTGGISDQWGGNLYVSNADSIQISESTIEYGNGRYGAGGAVFMDTSVVMVKGSYFEYNEGGREGGAVLVRSSNPFSLINATFVDTFFGFNIAAIGGGLMTDASNLRLFVLDSYFEGNSGYAWGGAAAIMEYSVVLLAGNTGKANTGGDCTDFYITDDWISYTCSEVWEYFWLSDSSAPPPSTMPPVGYPSSFPMETIITI